MKAEFQPPWFLKNPHLQTIIASTLRPRPKVHFKRQRMELPDGDFIDLDWITQQPNQPLVILFHGLEGSSQSTYAAALMLQLENAGLNGVVMNYRNCSGENNRLPRAYHAGETADIAYVTEHLTAANRYPVVMAVGYSLGGNALLKWLGETGEQNPLDAAAAVSVPFLLEDAAQRLDQGSSRLYQGYLLRRMKRNALRKLRSGLLPYSEEHINSLDTLRDYDDQLTAPLHGFNGYQDYYEICSSRQYLGDIKIPTLILHARDDPFMFPASVPSEKELAQAITLECHEHGGHVGFISNNRKRRFWLEHRLRDWAVEALEEMKSGSSA